MTNQDKGAPAQPRGQKRIKIDETKNQVKTFEPKDPAAPNKTPIEAAKQIVTSAVELRPDITQEIVLQVFQLHYKLKTKLRDLKNSRERMDDDAFLPRSAKHAFVLSAPLDVMETQEFKDAATEMEKIRLAYQIECKKRILATQNMVEKNLSAQIETTFQQGILKITKMLLVEERLLNDDGTPPTAKFAFFLIDEKLIGDDVYRSNETTHVKMVKSFDALIPTSESEEAFDNLLQKTKFQALSEDAKNIIQQTFHHAWIHAEEVALDNDTQRLLKKAAIEIQEGEKTEDTEMELDKEPSVEPGRIRDLIKEEIKKNNAALQREVNKLNQTVNRSKASPTKKAKNSTRGAPTSPKSASSTKKSGKPAASEGGNKGKGKNNANKKSSAATSPKRSRGTSPARKGKGTDKEKKGKQAPASGRQQPQKKGRQRQSNAQSP